MGLGLVVASLEGDAAAGDGPGGALAGDRGPAAGVLGLVPFAFAAVGGVGDAEVGGGEG